MTPPEVRYPDQPADGVVETLTGEVLLGQHKRWSHEQQRASEHLTHGWDGTTCTSCGEQIDPQRIQVITNAENHPPLQCIQCATAIEQEHRRPRRI
ncbi:MAG: hypothetical protein V1916_01105 [Patescibacteria group bacterium]